MSVEEDRQDDIKALQKAQRLDDKQFGQMKDLLNDLLKNVNIFMKTTNQTLQLHQEAIGIIAAKLKKMDDKAHQ